MVSIGFYRYTGIPTMVVVFALIFTTDPCVSTSQVPPAVPHPDGYFDGEVPFCGASKGDPQGALEAV